MPEGSVGAVLLAAGRARRMGATKVLLPWRGMPLLQHVIAVADRCGLSPIVVVVGHDAERVTAAVRLPEGARFAQAPADDDQQSASLRAGLAALEGTATRAAVVLLGDEPTVDDTAVAAVVSAWRAGAHPITRARYRDGAGHPVLLDRTIWPELRHDAGDAGARTLMAARPDLVVEVAVDTARPRDVDTAADYERLRGAGVEHDDDAT